MRQQLGQEAAVGSHRPGAHGAMAGGSLGHTDKCGLGPTAKGDRTLSIDKSQDNVYPVTAQLSSQRLMILFHLFPIHYVEYILGTTYE